MFGSFKIHGIAGDRIRVFTYLPSFAVPAGNKSPGNVLADDMSVLSAQALTSSISNDIYDVETSSRPTLEYSSTTTYCRSSCNKFFITKFTWYATIAFSCNVLAVLSAYNWTAPTNDAFSLNFSFFQKERLFKVNEDPFYSHAYIYLSNKQHSSNSRL